jgi:hypothetical protein
MISMYKIKSVLKLHGAGCEQRKLQGRMTKDDNLFGIENDFPLKLKPSMDTEFITSLFAIILRRDHCTSYTRISILRHGELQKSSNH